MKIELTGKHLEITPAIRAHVETQTKKLKQFLSDENTVAHLVVSAEKNRQTAELVITWREHLWKANESDQDLYAAITHAVDKVYRQSQKAKDKSVKQRQTREKTAVIAPIPDEEIPAEPLPSRIITETVTNLKPMTPDEAVLQLKDETRGFVIFLNAENEQTFVLYKRKDGNHGLIQT